MEELIQTLLSLAWIAVMCAPFAIFGVLFIAMGYFVVRTIRRRLTPLSGDEYNRAVAEADAYLGAEAQRLLPWSDAAFDELASEWRGTYTSFDVLRSRGYGPAHSNRDFALFNFVLFHRSGTGFVRAQSSQQRVHLNFGPDTVAATVDDRPLGLLYTRTGEIRDTLNRPIGQCSPRQGVAISVSGFELLRTHRQYPLVLDGRPVAQIITVQQSSLFGSPPPPLVPERRPDLSPDERDWLLAMCVLEVGYYGVTRSLSRRRMH